MPLAKVKITNRLGESPKVIVNDQDITGAITRVGVEIGVGLVPTVHLALAADELEIEGDGVVQVPTPMDAAVAIGKFLELIDVEAVRESVLEGASLTSEDPVTATVSVLREMIRDGAAYRA